jgi:hypothetical protein
MPLHVSSTMCSSSGGQDCIIQHLVSSHSVGGRPVHRMAEDSKHVEAYNKLITKQDFVH